MIHLRHKLSLFLIFFVTALKEFLDRSAIELQTIFNSAFGFWNMQGYLQQQIEDTIDMIADMKIAAENLLRSSSSSDMDGRGMPLICKPLSYTIPGHIMIHPEAYACM